MRQMKTIGKKISVCVLALLMVMMTYLSNSGGSLFLKKRDVKAATGEATMAMSTVKQQDHNDRPCGIRRFMEYVSKRTPSILPE